jgi:hypothetical protein
MVDPVMKTTLFLIALPGGMAAEGENLRLVVRIAPRIVAAPGATLAQCLMLSGSDGSGTWPDKLRGLRFSVQFGGGIQIDPAAGPDVTEPDPAVWQALLPNSLPIESYQAGAATGQSVNSYPVKSNFDEIIDGYRAGRVLPGELVTAPAVPPLAGLVPPTPEARNALRAQVSELQGAHRAVTAAHIAAAAVGTSAAPLHFDVMASYYDRMAQGARDRYDDSNGGTISPVIPALDLHSSMTVAARYPRLMRALGLVFDLEFAAASIPSSGTVRVLLSATAPAPGPSDGSVSFVSPWTRYTIDAPSQQFLAASKLPDSDLSGGMINLPDPATFCAFGVNFDELAHGVRSAALSFHAQTARAATPAGAPPPTLDLPAPRSDGLALSRVDWGDRFRAMLDAQAKLETDLAADLGTGGDGGGVTLGAEEVLFGFRVDIQREGETTWRSLCQRSGHYAFQNGLTRDWADEGTVTFTAFNPERDQPSAQIWAHETLFRWKGWSLSVPRPGKHVGVDGTPAAQDGAGAGNLPMQVQFLPLVGSLPRLRFGSAYSCRLRAVDIAGSSLPPDAPIPGPGMSLGYYLRFDPLLAPVLLARNSPGPGESIDRMVIRGDIDAPTTEISERLVGPPKATVQMAEWHSMFDTATGVDPGAYAVFAARDGNWPDGPYGPTAPPLPYLPDPLARRASLDFNPAPGPNRPPTVQVAFDGTWPDQETFRIQLAEGAAAPSWDPNQRILTVQMRKGTMQTIDLATVTDDAGPDGTPLSGLGLFDWWQAMQSDPRQARRLQDHRADALNGRLSFLTPARQLTFVHAVLRPMIQPAFEPTLTPVREKLGDTYCTFGGTTKVDGYSTEKIELIANWDETVDDGVNPPAPSSHSEIVWRRDFTYSEIVWVLNADHDPQGVFIQPKHEFRDTKYRRVTYRAVATTRYREYFPVDTTKDSSRITQTSPPVTVDVPASARPPAPSVLYLVPSFAWSEQALDRGTIRSRRGRIRVVMDRPWYRSGSGEMLGVLVAHKRIEDPQPPPDPGPIPVPGPLPAARILAQDAPGFEPPAGLPPGYIPFITQWGTDPARGSLPLLSPITPLPQHFTNAATVIDRVSLAEDPPVAFTDPRVDIAAVGFEVRLEPPDSNDPQAPADPNRHPHNGRWLCDIELDAGNAYLPMIRLALVRMQPNAMADATISRVILADIIAIASGRALSVVTDPTVPSGVVATVTGETEFPPNTASRIEFTVQADYGSPGAPLWLEAGQSQTAIMGAPVSFALPFARGTRPMRLVVREFEMLTADGLDRGNRGASRPVERLVYVDVVALGLSSLSFEFTTIDAPGAVSTVLQSLNDNGQIVGWTRDANGLEHSLLTDTHSFSTFDPPDFAAASQEVSFASGINLQGEIVGDAQNNDLQKPEGQAYLKQGDSFVFYSHPDADPSIGTQFSGINDVGLRVGFYTDRSGISHGIIQDGATTTTLESQPNILPNKSTWLFDINNSGQMVGGYFDDTSDIQHGLFADGTNFATIDFPGSDTTWLNGINDFGLMVGAYFDSATQTFRGFLTDGISFTVIDYPNLPQGFGTFAAGIDNVGRVVGYYGAEVGLEGQIGSKAAIHGFLATPALAAARID